MYIFFIFCDKNVLIDVKNISILKINSNYCKYIWICKKNKKIDTLGRCMLHPEILPFVI